MRIAAAELPARAGAAREVGQHLLGKGMQCGL